MGRGRQLRAAVSHEQPGEVVSPRRGVQQIACQRRVEDKALGGKATLQQRAGHVLHIVGRLADIPGEQAPQQALPVAAEDVRPQHRRDAVPGIFLAVHRQHAQVGKAVHRHMGRIAPQRQQPRSVIVRSGRFHRDGIVLVVDSGRRFRRGSGGGQTVFFDELGKFQAEKQVVQLRPVGLTYRVLGVEFQRRVGDDGGQPVAAAGRFLALRQLPQRGGLGLHVRHGGVQRVDAAVALDQRHGGLFPDARYAGDVVAAVAHQGLQVDHVDGIKAVCLPKDRRRHVGGERLAHAGGHQLDAGLVGDQLEAVLIAGHHHALPAPLLAAAGDGAQQVVGLVACQLVAGNGHGGQHLLHHRQLLGQLLRHPLAGGLVVGVCLMAEGGLPPVKRHAQRLGLFLVHEPLQHVEKAENGIGMQSLPGGQGLYPVKGAVDDAVAVKDHQFHGVSPCGKILITLYYSPLFGKTQPPGLTVFAFVID